MNVPFICVMKACTKPILAFGLMITWLVTPTSCLGQVLRSELSKERPFNLLEHNTPLAIPPPCKIATGCLLHSQKCRSLTANKRRHEDLCFGSRPKAFLFTQLTINADVIATFGGGEGFWLGFTFMSGTWKDAS